MRDVYHYFERVLDWLYPRACVSCDRPAPPGHDWCCACRTALRPLSRACLRCSRPLARVGVCGACQQSPPAFATVTAPYLYAHPLDRLVRQFKYARRLDLGRPLAALLVEHLQRAAVPRPEVLVPVPLHPSRLRARGFNQALELCRPLSRRLGIPCRPAAVTRLRATPAQAGLSLAQRRGNVRGAFAVAEPWVGARVALVDDVVTSGCTADEISRALLAAGAARVDVWALARA